MSLEMRTCPSTTRCPFNSSALVRSSAPELQDIDLRCGKTQGLKTISPVEFTWSVDAILSTGLDRGDSELVVVVVGLIVYVMGW